MFKKLRLLKTLKEVTFIVVVIFAITAWQEKDLLEDDGSEVIESYNLVNLQGEVEPLAQQGKRTLVYFFAPWCNVCELSIGNLNDLESEKLDIVRVALDYQTQNEVQRFVERSEAKGRVLLGTEVHKQRFNVPGYPTYYILDAENKIVASSFGYSTGLGVKLKNYLSST